MVGQLTGVVVAAAAGPAGEDLAPAFERAKPRYLTRRLKTLVHGAGAFPISTGVSGASCRVEKWKAKAARTKLQN